MARSEGQQNAANSLSVVHSQDQKKVISVTPAIGGGSDFTFDSGDLIFDATEIPLAVLSPGGAATLQSLTITDVADQKAVFYLVFANALTDFGTIDGAPDPDDTECGTVIGWLAVAATDYLDLGGASVGCIRNIGLEMQAAQGSTSLYVAGVNSTGTPNFGSAAGLVLMFGFER